MHCACAIFSSVACPALQYFFHISQTRRFSKKKKTKHKMCGLISSATFVWNISHFKKNCARYDKKSYVYWTVHHLDSWVKRDQLDATCFIITLFSAQHVSDVNTAILRSLRLIRRVTSWVVSGSMCVGVPLQCGYGGVVSVCRLKH